jgi:hypothetical protein
LAADQGFRQAKAVDLVGLLRVVLGSGSGVVHRRWVAALALQSALIIIARRR